MGQLRDGDRRAITVPNAEVIALWYIELHAQYICPRDGEQRRSAGGICGDKAANIDLTIGDYAAERRGHLLERHELRQPVDGCALYRDVRLRNRERRSAGGEAEAVLVALLSARPALRNQPRSARIGDAT